MTQPIQRPALAVADGWKEYRLLDCGDGMKQERWGPYTLVRPDPQVLWPRQGGDPAWKDWDGFYHRSDTGGGRWEFRRPLPEDWKLSYGALGLTFRIRPTSFKHTGLFPEQAVNWEWLTARIKAARSPDRGVSVLNLFGYTGAATCAAAAAGASVCHVDAAERALGRADPDHRGRLPEVREAGAQAGPPLRRHHHGSAHLRKGQRRGDVEARG